MSPFDYVQRVTKHLLTDLEKTSDTWSETWVPFSTKHPQFSTHVQVVRDVSNPRVSHPVPVLVGYTLPPRSEDPEKYALVIMSLLTPHSIGGMIKADPSHTWAKTLDRYLKAVEIIDPHRHRWLTNIVYNMQSISNGRAQQNFKLNGLRGNDSARNKDFPSPSPKAPTTTTPTNTTRPTSTTSSMAIQFLKISSTCCPQVDLGPKITLPDLPQRYPCTTPSTTPDSWINLVVEVATLFTAIVSVPN
jgi:hypothetical protein